MKWQTAIALEGLLGRDSACQSQQGKALAQLRPIITLGAMPFSFIILLLLVCFFEGLDESKGGASWTI